MGLTSCLAAIFDNGYHDKALVAVVTGGILAALPKLSGEAAGATHLLSVAIPLGMQCWVAFVAGPTMLRHLERQVFSDIQSRLFPKFGLIAASGSVIALVSQQILSGSTGFQSHLARLLVANVGFNVLNSAFLFPKQITALEQMKAESDDERKAKFRKTFGMFHGMSMLVNFAALGINCYCIYRIGAHIAGAF